MEILCYGTVPTSMLLNIMQYYMTIMTLALARFDGLVEWKIYSAPS